MSYHPCQTHDWEGHPHPLHEHCHLPRLLHCPSPPWGRFQAQVAQEGSHVEQEGKIFNLKRQISDLLKNVFKVSRPFFFVVLIILPCTGTWLKA